MKRIFLFTLFHFLYSITFAQEYDSLIKVSKLLRNQGEHKLAIQNYQYLLTKVSEKSKETAYLFNVLGVSYKNIGDKSNALKYYYAAIKLNKELKNFEGLRKNYGNLANYYSREEQFKKSNYYLRLVTDLETDPTSTSNGINLASFAQNYSKLIGEDPANADTVSFYLLKALSIFRTNKESKFLSFIYSDLAILYHKQKKHSLAKEYYIKSIELADSLNLKIHLVTAYRNLGNLYMDTDEFEAALSAYNKSLSLSEVEKNPIYQVDIYTNLVKAKMALGQVDEASILFQRFNKIKDSIYDAEKVHEVKEMETKYETELKEQAIKDQQITIANKNFEKNIFLTLTVLLVILIALAIWFFNQKQRFLKRLKNEEIANVKKDQELKELNAMMQGQEEERNRIANDLHDRLGARLSSIKLLYQNDSSLNGKGKKLVNYIDEAIKETREISHNLSTDMLTRFGLQTALKDIIRTIQESDQIEVDLVIYGMENRWPVDIERNVYYILLELINNTIKHANATKLMVQISQQDDEVNVFYEDNGRGFDKNDNLSNGLGMRSLQARINSIQGEMVLDTKINGGFNVVITFSVPEVLNSLEKDPNQMS